MNIDNSRSADLVAEPVAWLEMHSKLSNRAIFRHALAEFAVVDKSIFLLECDLGGGSDPFSERHRGRFINLGICEQALIDVGCGMVRAGWNVFAHTFSAFGSFRAAESIRLGMAYQQIPLKLFCDYSGLSGAFFGATHHAIEDLAFLRALPGMTVVSPADGLETIALVQSLLEYGGPVYVRLGRNRISRLPVPADSFLIGRGRMLREGSDIALIGHGEIGVAIALEVAAILGTGGISCSVVNLHTLKPLDEGIIMSVAANAGALVVTIEEHSVIGGLGGAVAEVLSCTNVRSKVLRIGVQDRYEKLAGSHEVLLEAHGLDVKSVAVRILQELDGGHAGM